VAPLVAPAVDLTILGLLLGTRHLAIHGATPDQVRPARGLLIFASLTTLALNIADPLVTGAYGKAAFDAVGPLLFIGWAEVGPGLLQAITTISTTATSQSRPRHRMKVTTVAVRSTEPTHRPTANEAPAQLPRRLRGSATATSVQRHTLPRYPSRMTCSPMHAMRTPNTGPTTDARSPPTLSARTYTSALPAPDS
jgi:hypothetical protein